MWVNWFIVAGILFIGEIFTAGFILFWFGIGAIVGAILALAGAHFYLQIAAAIIVSIVLLIFTRPIIKRTLKGNDMPSNVYALTGKRGIVVQEINNITGRGQVKIGGEVWKAESENGEEIAEGAKVEIVRVEGVRVIVK